MWNIQLTMKINFISFKDNNAEHVMHSKSYRKEIMIKDKADEIAEELFESLLNRYQNNLENRLTIVSLSLIIVIYCITNVIR